MIRLPAKPAFLEAVLTKLRKPSEPQEQARRDQEIGDFSVSVGSLAFCLEEMLYSEEISIAAIKKRFEDPGLIDRALEFTRVLFEDFEDKTLDSDGKEWMIASEWPNYIIEAMLMKRGISVEDILDQGTAHFLEGQDQAFSDELMDIQEAFYHTIISYMGYKKENMPAALIAEAANYAKAQGEDYTAGRPFKEWFPQALVDIGYKYDECLEAVRL